MKPVPHPALRSGRTRKRTGGRTRAVVPLVRPFSTVAAWGLSAVQVPVRIVSEANREEHWAVRRDRANAQKDAVRSALYGWRVPDGICVVTLTRIAPRKLDSDNLARAFKACRDQVAKWLGVDDGDERIQYRYAQRPPTTPGQYGIDIAFITRKPKP